MIDDSWPGSEPQSEPRAFGCLSTQPHFGLPLNRCVVPLTSFSEFDDAAKQVVWFALGEDRPLAFFAGIWKAGWTGVKKIKTGVETTDLYAFLTTDPNAEVVAIHPKAMPVILTRPDEVEIWMTAPWEEAKALQRSMPDGYLQAVQRGGKRDDALAG